MTWKNMFTAKRSPAVCLFISGGSEKASYAASAGYDNNQQSLVGNGYERLTIRDMNEFRLTKNLTLQAGIQFTQTLTQLNSQISTELNPGGGKSVFILMRSWQTPMATPWRYPTTTGNPL